MVRRSQPARLSLLEACLNVVAGFFLSLVIQAAVYPMFGIVTSVTTDGMIATVFTAASLVRSYLLRRAFEWLGQVSGDV